MEFYFETPFIADIDSKSAGSALESGYLNEVETLSPFINSELQDSSYKDIEFKLNRENQSVFEIGYNNKNTIKEDQWFSIPTVKIGEVTFPIDYYSGLTEEYREPIVSGNPLVTITSQIRNSRISNNFLVDEFARSQLGGNRKWDSARIDPMLVDNVQRLRSFIGKRIKIIDGYYSPKFLRSLLKISSETEGMSNPKYIYDSHITGRGVKISVDDYSSDIKQIAVASIFACDKDIKIGVGFSTMTLYVKPFITKDVNPVKELGQRFRSYLTPESSKQNIDNFLIDIRQLFFLKYNKYEKYLHKASLEYIRYILEEYFKLPDNHDYDIHLLDAVDIMCSESLTGDHSVILYCLAYSRFGNLYRYYEKNKMANKIKVAEEILARAGLLAEVIKYKLEGKIEDTYIKYAQFIESCIYRFEVNLYEAAPITFFDWKYNKSDEVFYDDMLIIIRSQRCNPITAQLPAGGTNSIFQYTTPNPDKPPIDFTGRYAVENPKIEDDLTSLNLLINQSGNFISCKSFGIFKKPRKSFKSIFTEFYGKINADGSITGDIFPNQIFRITKITETQIQFIKINTLNDKGFGDFYNLISERPFNSSQIVNSIIKENPENEELILTIAWANPLHLQMKNFLEDVRLYEKEITQAIVNYYNTGQSSPSNRLRELGRYVSALSYGILKSYIKLPLMFRKFAAYYIRYYYSSIRRWQPKHDAPLMSKLDWIKKMLEDFRDLGGSIELELYEFFGVETEIPLVRCRYKIKLQLNSIGFGPFSRSTGKISIENKTDIQKYPGTPKWTKVEYEVTLWNATLSLSLSKWLPKLGAGQSYEGVAENVNTPYDDSDFSGAFIQITEGTVFSIPKDLVERSGIKISTKTELKGTIILIEGKGKGKLDFKNVEYPNLPDEIEITPAIGNGNKSHKWDESISEMLPSITMSRGEIDTKRRTDDQSSIPISTNFAGMYQLQSTKFFKHDDSTLSEAAITAIGRMCAEEIIAFSDPETEIKIQGHTDASGKPDYNLKLSIARAENTLTAIKDRLGNKLRARNVAVEGLGEKEANRNGEFDQKNPWRRRVDIFINGRAVLSLGEVTDSADTSESETDFIEKNYFSERNKKYEL